MFVDLQGLRVSTDSAATLDHLNCFIDQALGYGNQAEAAINRAIAADPTCALAHTYAANYWLSQESREGQSRAVPYLQAAQRYKANTTLRERLYIDAIADWSNGKISTAIAKHEFIVEQFPQDLMAVQQGQYHYFYRGAHQSLLNIAEKAMPANEGNHYLYGMLAFGLEQCHRLEEAERLGRTAIAINRQDPWAQHAIAHVLETQGRVTEGIAWIESFADTWDACNSMLYTHNWWHVALYYLKEGDVQKGLELYDTHIWGKARQASPKDQVGAISLLLRLELEGLDVGVARWQTLASHVRARVHEHRLPFQDLHYIYALARAGEGDRVDEMLRSTMACIPQIDADRQSVWTEVFLTAAQGFVAHAVEDWREASKRIAPVLPHLWRLGGSHAQRELFGQVYYSALSQAERSSNPKRLSLVGDRAFSGNSVCSLNARASQGAGNLTTQRVYSL
jgi:tetratricopeptide (TPR) repeat protein